MSNYINTHIKAKLHYNEKKLQKQLKNNNQIDFLDVFN